MRDGELREGGGEGWAGQLLVSSYPSSGACVEMHEYHVSVT